MLQRPLSWDGRLLWLGFIYLIGSSRLQDALSFETMMIGSSGLAFASIPRIIDIPSFVLSFMNVSRSFQHSWCTSVVDFRCDMSWYIWCWYVSTHGLLWVHGMYEFIMNTGSALALYSRMLVQSPLGFLRLECNMPVSFPCTIVTFPPGWYLDSNGIGTLDGTMLVVDHMVLVLFYIGSYVSVFLVL